MTGRCSTCSRCRDCPRVQPEPRREGVIIPLLRAVAANAGLLVTEDELRLAAEILKTGRRIK